MTDFSADAGFARDAARPRGASGVLLGLVLVLVLMVPSFFVSVPGGPEILRSTDLIGAICIGLYVMIRTRPHRLAQVERLLLAFLFSSTALALGAFAWYATDADNALILGNRSLLYQLRLVLILAPALLACALALRPETFARLGLAFMAVAVLWICWMMFAYATGNRAYDAWQSLYLESGGRRFYFKRLGGLIGETGHFSFHATLAFCLLMTFAFLRGLTRLGYALVLLFPVFFAVLYLLSQARIGLITGPAVLLTIVFSGVFFSRAQRVLVGLAAATLALAPVLLQWRIEAGSLFLLRFRALLEGDVTVNEARFRGWVSSLEYLAYNPILGHGHRNVAMLSGDGTENFFLAGWADFGLVIFAVLIAFLVAATRPLFATRLTDLAAHSGADFARAVAVMRGTVIAAFLQWQVNDLITYFIGFPMLLFCIIYFGRIVAERNAALPVRAR